MEKERCSWANHHEIEQVYHDTEWGIPVHDDKTLFELLVLESMQAGLSWLTILKKRETLSQAYDEFDYKKIALYEEEDVSRLLEDPGVIRHKLKIKATISNAKSFMLIQEEYGSFDAFIWGYVNGIPIDHQLASVEDVPASTELSDRISKDLKKKGFKFLGSTTVYAYMQAIGLVNDHVTSCFKY